MNPRLALFLAIAFFESIQVSAREVQVLTVTTDAVQGTAGIKLVLDDDNQITGLQCDLLLQDGKKKKELHDMKSLKEGIVLMKYGEYEVMSLSSSRFDPKEGGELRLNYLYNGLTSERKDFVIELKTADHQNWSLWLNQRIRKSFSKMFLKSHLVLGKSVGIEQVLTR